MSHHVHNSLISWHRNKFFATWVPRYGIDERVRMPPVQISPRPWSNWSESATHIQQIGSFFSIAIRIIRFLFERKTEDNVSSTYLLPGSGAPQGLNLRTLLFFIFSKNLPLAILQCQTFWTVFHFKLGYCYPYRSVIIFLLLFFYYFVFYALIISFCICNFVMSYVLDIKACWKCVGLHGSLY